MTSSITDKLSQAIDELDAVDWDVIYRALSNTDEPLDRTAKRNLKRTRQDVKRIWEFHLGIDRD